MLRGRAKAHHTCTERLSVTKNFNLPSGLLSGNKIPPGGNMHRRCVV
ncbi:hypothetical protein BRYFOR_07770 [Marvinbryantia formatexigens DSM 14469]|uniref:Uncharacterized protein n=1 Tax=Marvinbryantia formatexigens DSM 14469 TaxID=478749 RepID=C6LGL0_9FIRM|nr:hypothetical protein BRYFOR_07770 [Marvinbryantia formatexigens DSM 14469]SDF58360.1 hypothetical protein SAMN05660368_00971 [Marvinbryantia formatexigens]